MAIPAGVAIHTRGLEKRYGDAVAVRSLDLDVRHGEVFGLLGPNGAGKTTSILMLLGLTEPTGGLVEVLGLDPKRDPLPVKRHVGYLPDNVGFYGSMTGRQNLRYTARLNGLSNAEAEPRIKRLLDRVGLAADAADDRVDTYSRGMKQRLGLADCLVKDPSVVILDEPTTSIDPIGVVEMLDLVRELAHDNGCAVLLSSHLLYQVQQVCDRIAIFVSGEVVAMGTVAEVARKQASGAMITLEVGADGPGVAVGATLRAVPGVVEVTVDEHDPRLWLVTCPPATRMALVKALVDAGQTPWHLDDRGMQLSEIYQTYFSGTRVPPSHRSRSAIAPTPVAANVPARVDKAQMSAARRRAIHRSERRNSGRPDRGNKRG